MKISGIDIIHQAFAKLGVFGPGQQIKEPQIAQAELQGTAALESLALESQFIPGTTIQDMTVVNGVKDYWLGPTAHTRPAPTGAQPNPPGTDPAGLRTSGSPDRLLYATFPAESLTVEGAEPIEGIEAAFFGVVESADDWLTTKSGQFYPGGHRFYLHDGSGSALVNAAPDSQPDPRSYREGNRRLEIFPVPASTFRVRLYLKVAEIMRLGRDVEYDFQPGLGELVITQTAAALATVYGVDPMTMQAVEQRANMALDRWKRKNARFRSHGAKAHLPQRWLGTVSDDGTSFDIEGPYRI